MYDLCVYHLRPYHCSLDRSLKGKLLALPSITRLGPDSDKCSSFYNRTSSLKLIKLITEDTKVKHTIIKTIYRHNYNRKYLRKLLKFQAGILG